MALAVASCTSTPGQPCAPGDYRHCTCGSAARGYARCADDGSAYGACDCRGAVPPGAGILVDGALSPADGGDATTLAAFLDPCGDDADCASHLCFAFNAYGPHCTIPCARDSDCPDPSPGCSGKSVCKLH